MRARRTAACRPICPRAALPGTRSSARTGLSRSTNSRSGPPRWRRSQNPIRRAFHRLCVFTGCRPGELARARWEDVDCKKRTLTIRGSAKIGKTKKNIVDADVGCHRPGVKGARDAHKIFDANSPWVFPAVSAHGHLGHWHDPGLQWAGNSGRHSHRTISADLGIDPLSARLLLGHSVRDVSEGYVTTALLTGSSLRGAQRRISRRILELMAGR